MQLYSAATALCLLARLAVSATPNVVIILTDDQDAQMGSLEYMPKVQKYLIDKGTNYKSHYCTVSLCCPSRVSMWTGKAAHNHNVTSVEMPYGGYPKFIQEGWNDKWLPVWLQQAGINMYYAGKLFNSFGSGNYDKPYPKGFAGTRFLLSPWTYLYFNPAIQADKKAPVQNQGKYTNDVVNDKTLELIDLGIAAKKPFVVVAAPIGPHSAGNPHDKTPGTDPPQPALRHAKLFPDAKVPRTANFNPSTPSGANWISKLHIQGKEQLAYNDEYYRRRLRTLQSIDEMVENIVEKLDKEGILDNTYIIYTSDNGYHIGQHRLPPGKICGYEEDINVPMIIRGPNVPQGRVARIATSHLDVAPTVLKTLGLSTNRNLDGEAMPLSEKDISAAESSRTRGEHVNIEFWGTPSKDGIFSYAWRGVINTYKGVRIVSPDYGFYYQIWCNNERELYDMKADPGQMNNLIKSNAKSMGRPMEDIINRLDTLLMVLKTCEGDVCVRPWATLQPGAGVNNLVDALDTKYDKFYSGQARNRFTDCGTGYITEREGATWKTAGKAWRNATLA